jgi:hypothetical protein
LITAEFFKLPTTYLYRLDDWMTTVHTACRSVKDKTQLGGVGWSRQRKGKKNLVHTTDESLFGVDTVRSSKVESISYIIWIHGCFHRRRVWYSNGNQLSGPWTGRVALAHCNSRISSSSTMRNAQSAVNDELVYSIGFERKNHKERSLRSEK